jgi:hypothetical protein
VSPSSWAYAGLRYLFRSLFPLLDSRMLARRLPGLRSALLIGLYAAACRSYGPRPYAGRVALLQSSQGLVHGGDSHRGWADVAPGLDVELLPGDHATSITAHAQVVAAHLRRYMGAGERAG